MRKKKLVAGVVSGVLVTGVAGSILFHTYQAKAEEKTLKQATTAVDSLYSSTKYKYLADNISNKKIEKAKELTEEVSDAKSKASLVRKVSNASIMLKAEDAVHEDIVNGVIVDNLTDAKIDTAEKAVEEVKPISKELYSDLSKELDVAEDQLKQIEKVKKIIKKPSYNWEAYKKLEKEINKVSNKASKTKFKEKLKEIKEKIKAKEKSEKESSKKSSSSTAQQSNNSNKVTEEKMANKQESSGNTSNSTNNENSGSTNTAASSQSSSNSHSSASRSSSNTQSSTSRSSGNSYSNSSSGSSKSYQGSNNQQSSNSSSKSYSSSAGSKKSTSSKSSGNTSSNKSSSNTKSKQSQSSNTMKNANDFVNDFNNGNYNHVGSGNNGTGNDYDVYKRGQ